MIEAIFYLQLLFLLAFIAFGIQQRSPAFLVFAFVLSVSTAVMISGEGIQYFEKWSYEGDLDIGDLNATPQYTTETIASSDSLNFWYYALLASGFVWAVTALVFGIKGRKQNVFVQDSSGR